TAPSISDFVILKPISRGAYGKVFLGAKKNNRNQLYAIKVMSKSAMHKKNLIMEYLIGGDLKSLIMMAGYLDERHASLYMAEMVIAVKYLHEHGIIHRDLKPDNILITAKGHLKLTDFGLSSVSWSKVLSPADVLYTPSATQTQQGFLRTPGQVISLTTDLSFLLGFFGALQKNSLLTESSDAPSDSNVMVGLSPISSIGGSNECYDDKLDLRLPRSSSPAHCRYVSLPHLRRTFSAVKLTYSTKNSLASSSSINSLDADQRSCAKSMEDNNKENVPYTPGFEFKTPSRPPRKGIRTKAPATTSFDHIGRRKHITSADFNNAICLSQLNPSKPIKFDEGTAPLGAQVTPLRTPSSDGESNDMPTRSFGHQPTPVPVALRLTGIPYDPHTSASFHCEPRQPPSSSALPYSRPRHVLGTPEYLAPELLAFPHYQQAADNPAVDWWALGVILFEMLTGVSPFADDNLEDIFDHIIKLDIPWPNSEETQLEEGGGISPQAEELIKGLLEREPTRRLEMAENIEQHAFFIQVGLWSNLQNVAMPFVPCPDGDADTCYFEVRS
ncbi:unnamed protein product, partial [Hydatigera taeniaeformis]|uniref:Serine/threonine-protein kinase greatwall n=1 Tax=Hydatigena taeniaeformis TaxID=6205 RepID=A0A0R3WZ71_HYDTA